MGSIILSSFCRNIKARFSRILAQMIKRQNMPSAFTKIPQLHWRNLLFIFFRHLIGYLVCYDNDRLLLEEIWNVFFEMIVDPEDIQKMNIILLPIFNLLFSAFALEHLIGSYTGPYQILWHSLNVKLYSLHYSALVTDNLSKFVMHLWVLSSENATYNLHSRKVLYIHH